ncbi:MAG: NERD domain-containing protein, partial [Lysinibacillus sp.]|nr:NERD domain-containing protein [Lysinibacillus sp.]
MAQLVKLQDYISRYEIDLTRYPTQYVRLKRTQWDKVKH